ncbi:hypothetical protein SLA2020_101900 [Shorea laevis]
MADIVSAVINVVSCICNAPTCNYIDSHINFDDDVEELRRNLGDLNNRKQDIESRMLEVRLGQVVRQEVQGWNQNVQTINVEVQALLEKVHRAKWYKHARLGKLVRRKIDVVKAIYDQGVFSEGLVINRATVDHGIIIPTENLVGEISTKDEIWGYLMGNQVRMIGVIGIGGVGKTTIMKHINNELLRGNHMFHKVLWVTVSYPLNIFELQKNIASAMGERLSEYEQDQMRRAAKLMKIVERWRYVLILDDVWEKFSLKDVGILEPSEDNGCKVVITSRSADVCNYLGCKIVRVQCLSPEESLNLFLDKVGRDVLQVPKLEEILKLIVVECAGLPLAIVVIAGTMKGEYDIHVWRDALNELRECVKRVKGLEDEIFERLRFSYDRLRSSEVQHCFLYCSLFKEDYLFYGRKLIEEWIDEGLIDVLASRQGAYDRGHAILSRLEKNCLLEKTIDQSGNDGFKMHDVLRDMAIKIIGPEFGYGAKAGRKMLEVPDEHEWVNLKKMSLMANGISKIPFSLRLKCPTLSTLNLSENPLYDIPESFFKNMSALKVLDLSDTEIVALPNSISGLENLTTLRLQRCKRLEYFPSIGKLTALKKLDLKEARIKEVPQEMKSLTSLEYLDLFCPGLRKLPTGILSNLSRLQYLRVYYGLDSSALKIEGKVVARLSKLEAIVGRFSDIEDLNYFSESKHFQSLWAYRLLVGSEEDGGVFRNFARHDSVAKHLIFSKCNIGGECVVIPNNLETLQIRFCCWGRSLNNLMLLEKAMELTSCTIYDCQGIECLFHLNSSSSSCYPVLDKLEILHLYSMPSLQVLVSVEGVATPPQVFSNLKDLSIKYCSGIRKLLPLELLQAHQNLEKIEVSDCEKMEEIIASSDLDASSDKFIFPKLRELKLIKLPQLKSICNGKGVMVCDSIEDIRLIRCPELKRIAVQVPLLDNGQLSPPPCLREILIHKDSKEWWESVEWDHPNAKKVLQPFLKYSIW